MKLITAFDRWIVRGPFTARDLGVFRIIFAVLMLVVPWRFRWIGGLPGSMFAPPPGLIRLFPGVPADGWFAALEVALVVALVMMGLGLATRWASLLVTGLLVVGVGFSYSFGKIDHSILAVIAPAVLSFSNWGSALSLDSLISRSARPMINQWAVRLMAIMVSISFATAATVKIATGWLAPSSQVVEGYFLRNYITNVDHNPLSDLAASIQSPRLWEVMDWAVVGLELLVAVGFLSWRLLRISLAAASLFHFGVYLLLGIKFYWNVLVYGAFVEWRTIGRAGLSRRAKTWSVAVGSVLLFVLGAVVIASDSGVFRTPILPTSTVLWVGAGIGAGYLLFLARSLVRRAPRIEAQRRKNTAADGKPLGPWMARILRLVVVALIVSFPTSYIYAEKVSQPYPALFQPDFRGPGPLQNGRIRSTQLEIAIEFEDGSTRSVDADRLLSAPISTDAIFKAAFYKAGPNDAANTQWLAGRIEQVFGKKPTSVTATWSEHRYDPISGRQTWIKILKSRTIEFDLDG